MGLSYRILMLKEVIALSVEMNSVIINLINNAEVEDETEVFGQLGPVARM